MYFKRINFSSIRARITLFALLGVVLMAVIALVNGYLTSRKAHFIEMERTSYRVSTLVLEGMRLEAIYMNKPKVAHLAKLEEIQTGVLEKISSLEKTSRDSNVETLAVQMNQKVEEHRDIFKKVATNVNVVYESQKEIIGLITLTEMRFESIIHDVDMQEAMLLMEKGESLDPTRIGLRNETKDILRLGDGLQASIQALLLFGDQDIYNQEIKDFRNNVQLRVQNISTTLKTLKSAKYDNMWEIALEKVPVVMDLETVISSKWKENMEIEGSLVETQNQLLDAAKQISEYTTKMIDTVTKRQARVSLFVTLGGMGALFFFGFVIARSIIKPVNRVVQGLKDISQGGGDLTVRLSEANKGEMGELARCFNQFVSTQHDMISDITLAANSLAAYTADVTSTAAQMAASAAEETTTVTEVSTTTEEVKQTVALSSDKAEQVTMDADSMMQVSQKGLKVTEESAAGMELIREEMENIAQSIMQLSSQTINIEEIINAVNELANQSDLLSVNASIEAAKAGEFGKGFSVVAQEVKNLASQSKQSTAQVRQILGEIHRATNAAILAAERGAKAVEKGVTLSSHSGEAIQKLSHSIEASVRSAQQIASSCRQQLAGMEQLDMAMKSIKDASSQNLDSSQRLEKLTQGLHDLGKTLEDQTGRFKL
ncbi:MAG: methyl-accepting chemotaxis protein [Desulfatibacillum sp.]|nr:methyl-accepting chemotaxis protein [Desulfatibacillum sp.]